MMSLRVLMVDDSEDDTILILSDLKRGGFDPHCQRVETAKGLQNSLAEQEWDIVFVDCKLPQFHGLEAMHMIKQNNPDIPFIAVSGRVEEKTANCVMRAGARDYIPKFSRSRLVPVVERELRDVATRREQLRAEKILREREEKFRMILEHLPVILYTACPDRSLITLHTSAWLERVLGFTKTDFTEGWDLWKQRVHPDDRDLLLNDLWFAHRQKEPFAMEYRMICKDGRVVWLRDEAVLIHDAQGKPLFYEGVMHDITERKHIEEELCRVYDELEALKNQKFEKRYGDSIIREQDSR